MTKTEAKKSINAMMKEGKIEKKAFDQVASFCSENHVTLLELLNKSNLAKAQELGLIKPHADDKPADKNADKQADKAKLDAAKLEAAKKVQEQRKVSFNTMQKVIKDNLQKTPQTLFRIAWKEKKTLRGCDVFAVFPIVKNGKINLVGRLLEELEGKLIPSDNIITIQADMLALVGNTPVVYDSNGKPLSLGIQFPKVAVQQEPAESAQEAQHEEKPEA